MRLTKSVLKKKLKNDIKQSKQFIRNMQRVGHPDYEGLTYQQVADLLVREKAICEVNEAMLFWISGFKGQN